jgi:tripartite-type tricarboxylate transporter receptor subunit TctC
MTFADRFPRVFFLLSLAALTLASPHPTHAQAAYPDRPVRIVLPFAAGGVADITARIVAEKLGNKLGQRFYVENQAGAGGINAARTVIASPSDGYTLALLSNGTAVSVSLFKKLPFDPLKDFAPISSLGFFDFIFATSANSEFKTVGDFIAAAKTKPGALNVGTINIGSTQNLSAELFKTAANIDFTIVPYRGTPEIEVSLLQGNVALMIDSYAAVKGNLADGKFRALASSGPIRSENTPDVVTVRESGVTKYDVVSWNALFAPAGTPEAIVDKIEAAIKQALAAPDVRAKLEALSMEIRTGAREDLRAVLAADMGKWGRLVKEKNIQIAQ